MLFLLGSIEKLTELLETEWLDKFKQSKTNKYVNNDYDLDLLTQKGVFPYDYMDCFDKFNDTELPCQDKF